MWYMQVKENKCVDCLMTLWKLLPLKWEIVMIDAFNLTSINVRTTIIHVYIPHLITLWCQTKSNQRSQHWKSTQCSKLLIVLIKCIFFLSFCCFHQKQLLLIEKQFQLHTCSAYLDGMVSSSPRQANRSPRWLIHAKMSPSVFPRAIHYFIPYLEFGQAKIDLSAVYSSVPYTDMQSN